MSMDLEPIDSGHPDAPVVSDVDGRLWRVRTRPPHAVVDVLLGAVVLVVAALIAAALLL
jgi:hypothetical protein